MIERVSIAQRGGIAAAHAATSVLANGGIILYPTDTIYGLGVDATNPEALERLYWLKGRDEGKPVSVLVDSVETIERYTVMNDAARNIAAQYLPGALTLVLPVRDGVSLGTARDGTASFRIPDDPFCLALAQAFGKPITATSANRSGVPTESFVDGILAQFGARSDQIALVIDDGLRTDVLPSTVVSCVGETPKVLRHGAIALV